MRTLNVGIFVLLTLVTTTFCASEDSKTLLDAVNKNDLASVKQILAAQADSSPLRRFAVNSDPTLILVPVQRGRTDILESLITAGFKVDVVDPNTGNSALYYASDRGYLDVVKVLLGANPTVVRSDDLNIAVKRGFADIVTVLLAAGAPVNALDRKGATALTVAAASGQPDMVKLLLDHRADPNEPDKQGLIPLIAAVRNGNPASVRLLLNAGANPGGDQAFGASALPTLQPLPPLPSDSAIAQAPERVSPLIAAESENKAEIQQMLQAALVKSGTPVGSLDEVKARVGQQLRVAARVSDPAATGKLRMAVYDWETVFVNGGNNIGWDGRSTVTPEWILAFNGIGDALDYALQQRDSGARTKLLSEIADDVTTKAEFCLSVGGSLASPVDVPVVTFRAGKRIDLIQVCWKPAILEFQGDPCQNPFNKFSSLTEPTTAPIIPGRVLLFGHDTRSKKALWQKMPIEVTRPTTVEAKEYQFPVE